jgi:hypothetical protein
LKAIFDEGVPRLLRRSLEQHGCMVEPFPNQWKGLKNGKLLDRLDQSDFDCLITCDKNLEWQQSLHGRKVAIVVLPYQKLVQLEAIAGQIVTAVSSAKHGFVTHAGPGSAGKTI